MPLKKTTSIISKLVDEKGVQETSICTGKIKFLVSGSIPHLRNCA